MLLHTKRPSARGFAPESATTGSQATYQLDPLRCVVAIGLLLLLIGSAFLAHRMAWPEAANVFLHLTELAFGGIVGLLFGEQAKLATSKEKAE